MCVRENVGLMRKKHLVVAHCSQGDVVACATEGMGRSGWRQSSEVSSERESVSGQIQTLVCLAPKF